MNQLEYILSGPLFLSLMEMSFQITHFTALTVDKLMFSDSNSCISTFS